MLQCFVKVRVSQIYGLRCIKPSIVPDILRGYVKAMYSGRSCHLTHLIKFVSKAVLGFIPGLFLASILFPHTVHFLASAVSTTPDGMNPIANGVMGLGNFWGRSPTARSILAGQFLSAENSKGRVKRTKCTCFSSQNYDNF